MLASAPTFTITLTHSRQQLAQGLAPAQADLTLGQLLSLSSGATPHQALVQITQLQRTQHNGKPVIAWEATCLQGSLTLHYTQARPVGWGAWLRSLQTAYPLPWLVADKLTLDCERLSGLTLLATATESELRQQLKVFTDSLPPTTSLLMLDIVGLDPSIFKGSRGALPLSALSPTQTTVASPWQWQHLPEATALSIDLLGPSAFLRLVCQALPEPLQQQALVQLASCLPHEDKPLLGMASLGQPAYPMHPLLKRELKALHEAGLLAAHPQDVLNLAHWQNGQQRRLGLGLSQWPRHRLAWVIEALQQLTIVPLSHVSTAWVVLPLPDAALIPLWQPLLLRLAQVGFRCLVAVVGSQPIIGKQLPHPLGDITWDSVILLTQQHLVLWGHVAGQAEVVIPIEASNTDPLALHLHANPDDTTQSKQADDFINSDDSCTPVSTPPTPNEPLDAFIWRQLGDFKGGQGMVAVATDATLAPPAYEAEPTLPPPPPEPLDTKAIPTALSSFQLPLAPETDDEAEPWQAPLTATTKPAATEVDSGELNSYQAPLPPVATTQPAEAHAPWHPCLPEDLHPWVEANEEPWQSEPVMPPLSPLPEQMVGLAPEPNVVVLEAEAWENTPTDTPPLAPTQVAETWEPVPIVANEPSSEHEERVATAEPPPPMPTEDEATLVDESITFERLQEPALEAEPVPPEAAPEELPTASLADVMMNQQTLTLLEAELLPVTHPPQGVTHDPDQRLTEAKHQANSPLVVATETVKEPIPTKTAALPNEAPPPADLPDWLAFEPVWDDNTSTLPSLSDEDWVGITALPSPPTPAPVLGLPNLNAIDALLAELPTYTENPTVVEAAYPAEATAPSTPPSTPHAMPEATATDHPASESPVNWVNKRVQHDTYGEGTVLKAIPLNGRLIMTVEFDRVGKRMLDPELSLLQLL